LLDLVKPVRPRAARLQGWNAGLDEAVGANRSHDLGTKQALSCSRYLKGGCAPFVGDDLKRQGLET
jgi:hypothetical protein